MKKERYNAKNQPRPAAIMLTTDSSQGATMPVETAGGFAALWKALGLTATSFGIGGALATVVVMCIKRPRTAGEWAVALISTVVASFGGGAYVILHYSLLRETQNILDVFAIIGIVFSCGLPGWLLVRLLFNQLLKADAEGKGLADVVRDIKGSL